MGGARSIQGFGFGRRTWREYHSEDLGVNGKNIRMGLDKIGWESGDWIHLAQDRIQCGGGSCERGNEPFGSVKGRVAEWVFVSLGLCSMHLVVGLDHLLYIKVYCCNANRSTVSYFLVLHFNHIEKCFKYTLYTLIRNIYFMPRICCLCDKPILKNRFYLRLKPIQV
jgi:hypothetical protein